MTGLLLAALVLGQALWRLWLGPRTEARCGAFWDDLCPDPGAEEAWWDLAQHGC